MIETTRRVWAEIDLKAFKKNLAVVSELSPNSKIFPVAKSNAYGHGVVEICEILSKCKIKGFCVALLDEVIHMRNNKIEKKND